MSPTASHSEPLIGEALVASPQRAVPVRSGAVSRAIRWLRRAIFLVHRWLGVGIALLMAVWALSGLVMMYVSFPETTSGERLAGLAPLEAGECCAALPSELAGSGALEAISVEMLGGQPVLRWVGAGGLGMVDLATGQPPVIDAALAGRIAAEHFSRSGSGDAAPEVAPITRDQWTVYGRFRQHAPLFKASFADEAGTALYVSGATGEVVQDTNSHERFWNWLGAVPHWLYFTAFREIQWLWYDFVVYASVLGVFLTATGLYLGIRMYGRGKRRSPYRGLALWHHWTGLIFGVVTLTWTASGLFSMQPWGWFESAGPEAEAAALSGRPIQTGDAALLVQALEAGVPDGAVSASLAVQQGKPYAVLANRDGQSWRAVLPSLAPAPLENAELAQLAGTARPGVLVTSQQLIRTEDAYYFGHKSEVVLPAWRIIYADEEATRLYIDPRTGEGISKVDSAARAYRWLHYGLHRMDFTGLMRSRPLWDIITLPLMLGVSLLCVIGTWLGWRRLRRTVAPKRLR